MIELCVDAGRYSFRRMPLSPRLAHWYENIRKLVRGRPPWSAEDELAYYRVTERLVAEHRQRQAMHARQAYFPGLRTMRDLDLLDTDLVLGANILDIGAGEGQLAQAVAHAGAREVWALDVSPKQLFAPAERACEGLRFVIASASDTPFGDESFDGVTAHLVLHHIEPLGPLLHEVSRVLRPGGWFVAVEPTPLIGLLAHGQTSENESPISPARVKAELKTAGFSEISHRYHWSRLDTSKLGPLSPSYVVRARKPGPRDERGGPAVLRRPLVETGLPGLSMDSACSFAELALAQAREVLDILEREEASRPADVRAIRRS